MRPTVARCSHTHGSASRRRNNFVPAGKHKTLSPGATPAERNARETLEEAVKSKAA
ncbi:hypothetical protein [Vibrio sp. WJH972]